MIAFRGQKGWATPRLVSFRGLIQNFRQASPPLSYAESPPGGRDWFTCIPSSILLSYILNSTPVPLTFNCNPPLTRAVINRAITRDTQRQFSENICSEDDMRSRIFGTFFVKFLACLPLLKSGIIAPF